MLSISDFDYNLPDERIAKYPLEQRDLSKLLVYRDGQITDDTFSFLANHLPENSLLVYNETRVIQARLLFRKTTGAEIEIFCLEPIAPADYALMFQSTEPVVWKCLVGNNKKWKEGGLTQVIEYKGIDIELTAQKIAEHDTWFEIQFNWSKPDVSFAQILELSGHTPIPPYLKRESEEIDKRRYQTIYSQFNGSVAAPTAGLHFTPALFERMEVKDIQHFGITLHVGAGTFKPVSAENALEHEMHTETFIVNRKAVYTLIEMAGNITAVGTTSLRALESLYWCGVKLIENKHTPFEIHQWDWQKLPQQHSLHDALHAVEMYLDKHKLSEIQAQTSIMVIPGYQFRIVDRLVTNFHQPKSTLLLLVCAFIGNDWKKIYEHALKNDYRFLSYGDGSLLFRK